MLLQLAHPFVAAGVDDHSTFQSDILRRLFRTVYFVHSMVFDDLEGVRQSVAHFDAAHARIRGKLGNRAGNLDPETVYTGHDPHAKLWVFATLTDAGLRTYEHLVRRLTPDQRQRYYRESLVQARLLGIPDEILPQSMDAFNNYMRDMLTGNTLAVTDTAYRLGQAVLYPEVGPLPKFSAWFLRLVTAALLPERFRKAYGLKWGRGQKLLFGILCRTMRVLRPLAPAWIWQSPLRRGKLPRFMIWGGQVPERSRAGATDGNRSR